MIKQIKKRDGTLVPFEREKITAAISRALAAGGVKANPKSLSGETVRALEKNFANKVPGVEDVQELIITVLKKHKLKKIADEYGAYMKEKEYIRKLKGLLGITPETKLTPNAIEVLRSRYLLKDENGKIMETPVQMFRRVASTVAAVDRNHGEDPKKSEKEFFDVMGSLEFLPNSPTLFNAGAPLGQLSACFVLPVEDSLQGIFTAVMQAALIEQTGGGVGFSFSRLRPKGDLVKSTKGVASGPVSFMRVFDVATDVIKAGGKRRGAMMGILRVDHPDIMEFIRAKEKPGFLSNFNISVAVTDSFMAAVSAGKKYALINPRTKQEAGRLDAREVWSAIIGTAWQTGDPGVIFLDEINRHNPTLQVGEIESTNPCGEQPLLPFESCNLGSINLAKMVSDKSDVDWERLKRTVKVAVHFLDNVIDANRFPLPETEKVTLANRKIGLGVMGWADMLVRLGISYDSEKAVALAEKLMGFINVEARKSSEELGKKRGSFANFPGSPLAKKYSAMRNATVTTVAPTGTLSIIAGCSSGIEPLFAIAFMRHILEGRHLFEVNPEFERAAKRGRVYSAKLLEKIIRAGSVQKIAGVPKKLKGVFVTAADIKPYWHVRMQAAFQKHVDNAVSKTINFPQNAKVSDVRKAYELAWKLKCKGITVYRYGSKPEQVLYIGETAKYVHAEAEYAGGCPTSTCPSPS
jgi:ribonucleoside-diphosphate reductase alpha chain